MSSDRNPARTAPRGTRAGTVEALDLSDNLGAPHTPGDTGAARAARSAGAGRSLAAETDVGLAVAGIAAVAEVTRVTPEGAAWLASAGTYPRSARVLREDLPTAPVVLACGSVFDVVSAPAIFGRLMLDRLWGEGPGTGPVAAHRGRMLLFAAPGTAQRLPSLLRWEERGSGGASDRGRAIPPLLCHGTGDAVTVPGQAPAIPPPAAPPPAPSAAPIPAADAPAVPAAVAPHPAAPAETGFGTRAETAVDARLDSRWLVAPDTRHPWLPGPEVMLWAAVRAARSAAGQRFPDPSPAAPISIFPPTDQGAKVYDVSRRR